MDNILYPLRCHLDIMINAGLMINTTTETCTSYSNQCVRALLHQYESTATVACSKKLFLVLNVNKIETSLPKHASCFPFE